MLPLIDNAALSVFGMIPTSLGLTDSGIAEVVFFLSLAWGAYVYVLYPIIVAAGGALRPRSAARYPFPSSDSLASHVAAGSRPTVTLLIAAFNEEAALASKLENSLQLDYPNLSILVLSDGSTDRTDAIAREYEKDGVELLRVEGRLGKTYAQNQGVDRSTGEILVFSDANSLYDADAITRMVAAFADPTVGVVEGRRVDHAPHESETATTDTEMSFRDYESSVKCAESRLYTCVGATGPIYAVRRSAYVPPDPSEISDLLEPLLVHSRHGLRQVFEPQAISREPLLETGGDEFGRKIRIITRCLSSLVRRPELWCPGVGCAQLGFRGAGRRLVAGWQLWSHRLLRWLLPIPMVALLVASAALAGFGGAGRIYLAALIVQLGFYGAAAVGYFRERYGGKAGALRYPYYFCLANLAAAVALVNLFRGRRITVWSPQR